MILLSSHVQRVPVENLRETGFAACVLKPARLDQLRECLTKSLRYAPSLAPAAAAQPPSSRAIRGRLLLAEDNAVNQKVSVRILEKLGYYVDTVGNGAEAVEKLQCGLYDAILMDCQMPEMDGYAATREIRRREGGGRHTTIIAMTASAMSGDREKCLAAGMDDYVTKPVRSEDLQQTLQRHLAKSALAQPGVPGETAVSLAGEGELVARIKELELEVGEKAMQELVGEFLSETLRSLEKLKRALGSSDSPSAVETLHAMVDSTANVGAVRLAEVCSQLECAIREGAPQDWEPLLSQLEEMHLSITAELEEIYPASRFRTKAVNPPYPVSAG
jgi:CheY-like chemotaxis protein/HPt (histidine-containing phosphotransfer) domain-containing protein